jgi:hypothetical protein
MAPGFHRTSRNFFGGGQVVISGAFSNTLGLAFLPDAMRRGMHAASSKSAPSGRRRHPHCMWNSFHRRKPA